MKYLIILSLFLYKAWACEVLNLTGSEFATQRQELFTSNDSGIRIAFNGIKGANSQFGLGAVNATMESFERDMCRQLPQGSKVYKTDFKGYFVKCDNCEDVSEKLRAATPGLLPDGKTRLSTTNVIADSFKEGYVKARVINEYGSVSGDLTEFINKEMKETFTETANLRAEPDFNQKFREAIEKYRKGKVSEIDPRMQRLIKALDVLVEVPFSSSNNIDEELLKALNDPSKIASAQTGDDLYIVIKDNQNVSRVIGADAKGLGVMNISSRLEVLERVFGSENKIESIEHLYSLSIESIQKADEVMENSMKEYERILRNEIERYPNMDLDTNISNAHQIYLNKALEDPNLMEMRSASLSDCRGSHQSLMNRITAIHNRLKMMEAHGVKGFFGSSCIGAQYWLLKHGI